MTIKKIMEASGDYSPRTNSVFTKAQEIFIVQEFGKNPSPTAVKNAFTKKFKNEINFRVLSAIKLYQFTRVRDRFLKNGIATPKPVNKGKNCTDEEKVLKIENFFIENPMDSITEASRELEIPYTTIQRILKTKIKMKFYRPTLAQSLTSAHKTQRLNFCQWLLEQEEDFVHSIIWGDEKWFHLSQHPNRKNVGYWSVSNPYFVVDSKSQGAEKIMAFVCMVNGIVLPVIWHVDEDGKPISVNSERYRKVFKEEVLPCLPEDLLDQLWWMQDGATAHTANESMNLLRETFGERIISRLASKFGGVEWPSHSPDLNPLDYSFWSQAMSKVWKAKCETIEELVSVVEEFFSNCDEDLVRKTVSNILKRAKLCVQEKGGHFDHKM